MAALEPSGQGSCQLCFPCADKTQLQTEISLRHILYFRIFWGYFHLQSTYCSPIITIMVIIIAIIMAIIIIPFVCT